MFELDSEYVNKLLTDFSMFHPTVNQMKIMYDLCNQIAEKSGLNPQFIRSVYISAVVRQQINEKRFHYEIEENLPYEKVRGSIKILDYIENEFLKFIKDQGQIATLMKMVHDVMDYYVENYAGRDPNEELP